MGRPLQLVLYGASGFTGRLVASYLARTSPSLRLGLAGRSLPKLIDARHQASQHAGAHRAWDPELLVARTEEEAEIRELASRTDVLLSTAGPFSACGTPLVRACLDAKTDYIDINGEVPWMRRLVDEFDEEARRDGVRIVPSCGYTVPSDLGAWLTVRAVREHYGCGTRFVRGWMQFNGRLSGGTMATGLLLDRAKEEEQVMRKDPFLLGGAPAAGVLRAEDIDNDAAEFDGIAGSWTAPFWMAAISSRIVRRSHGLFRQHDGEGYGSEFGYSERALAKDESVARNMATETPAPKRRERLIARGKLPSPGEGPSAEVRDKSWFRLLLWGKAENGRSILTEVSGGDPGYNETSKMVSEAALLLVASHALPKRTRDGGFGGVLTPSFAFGEPLLRALVDRGIHFSTQQVQEDSEIANVVHEATASPPDLKLT